MKVLVTILHGGVFLNRYDNIIKTWGKDIDHIFYSDYEDIEKNIIKVSNSTSYGSNEEKHINSLKYVNENKSDYDWFFFCDDDTFVNIPNLMDFIKTADPTVVHGSLLDGTWPTDLTLKYCSGGAGYLIHKDVLSEICKTIRILGTNYSDVTLGHKLRELNIGINNDDRFKSQHPSFYNINFSDCCDHITFHYIKEFDDMNDLYNTCK